MIRRPPRSTRLTHSFPTRRSSDLALPARFVAQFGLLYKFLFNKWYFDELFNILFVKPAFATGRFFWKRGDEGTRSEEHTSELQSLMRISYAVFCLKTKNQITYPATHHNISHHEYKSNATNT